MGVTPHVVLSCHFHHWHHHRSVGHPETRAASMRLAEEPCAETVRGQGTVVALGVQGHCLSQLEPSVVPIMPQSSWRWH